ncbi:glycosyl hydrolase family 28 protein [Streptomyces sp. RLB1-33]|uniref:glycosyl hydrolase family 28 protein n=1 Tax=Streptomyces mirabilis TaxID=68239 RepID=UPI00143EAB8F|nr:MULTISPECIES: glycosyl hydrolase family 28 protein [Streptomyces]QIY74211.1 endo-polygalacturonase [Streptomyces sp. RLB1-33]QUW78830.1 endo-polygalacturonase [Streptomyces mirabilis]
MNTPLSRRTALQAAGATVLAAGLSGGLTATAVHADDNSAPKLVTYPRPSTMPTNTSFKVRVRVVPDGEWQTLDIWRPRLEEINPTTGSGKVWDTSMVYFDFRGSVELEITYLKGGTTKARVRPDALGITPELLGDTVRFTLDEPRDVVVQTNDQVFDCLHVFTNHIDPDPPAADDPDVIYFGPGMHTVTGGVLTVPSGKTVYLEGGAVLAAQVYFKDVEKASLTGHGMLYAGTANGVLCEGSKNIRVEDVIVMNPGGGYIATLGESENVHIKNLRGFSSRGNGDGIDVFSSSSVVIDGCFLRNSDDCIAIYAHRWDYYGDTRDITVQNCILWADVAHPINVGTHGNTDAPEVLENLVFKNLDILDHREPQMGYQGCIALNPGDSNLIKNVLIEDVRIEDFRWGQVIHMRVMYNTKYNTSVGRGIEDVYVKNLTYTGTHANPSLFLGYDADHAIKDVTFENLVINGTVIADSMKKPKWYATTDSVQWYYNEHVLNLTFLTTAEAEAAAAS